MLLKSAKACRLFFFPLQTIGSNNSFTLILGFKIAKFELKVTVHYALWAKCTQLRPFKLLSVMRHSPINKTISTCLEVRELAYKSLRPTKLKVLVRHIHRSFVEGREDAGPKEWSFWDQKTKQNKNKSGLSSFKTLF